jgi:hypothetical protein
MAGTKIDELGITYLSYRYRMRDLDLLNAVNIVNITRQPARQRAALNLAKRLLVSFC